MRTILTIRALERHNQCGIHLRSADPIRRRRILSCSDARSVFPVSLDGTGVLDCAVSTLGMVLTLVRIMVQGALEMRSSRHARALPMLDVPRCGRTHRQSIDLVDSPHEIKGLILPDNNDRSFRYMPLHVAWWHA